MLQTGLELESFVGEAAFSPRVFSDDLLHVRRGDKGCRLGTSKVFRRRLNGGRYRGGGTGGARRFRDRGGGDLGNRRRSGSGFSNWRRSGSGFSNRRRFFTCCDVCRTARARYRFWC